MQRKMVAIQAAVLVVWTLLSLGAWGVVNVIGDALISRSAAGPEGEDALTWLLSVLQGIGFGAVVLVWLLGIAAIVAVAWLVRRLAA